MNSVTNKITAGDYKNSNIQLKGASGDEPVLICKGFLSKKEIPIAKINIKLLTHSIISQEEYELVMEWTDGKISQAIVDKMTYQAIRLKCCN